MQARLHLIDGDRDALDGSCRVLPGDTLWPIENIRICDRHRHDLGDIKSLAANIAEIGLLQSIVITLTGELIVGRRRLAACQLLDWREIPLRIIDVDQVARAEFAENFLRKDFTMSELVAIRRTLEPVERAAARERQAIAGPTKGRGAKATGSGKLPEAATGRVRDRIARIGGISGRTLEKANEIVTAAEEEPEKIRRSGR
jgi:ParB family chromosome partitioning protein